VDEVNGEKAEGENNGEDNEGEQDLQSGERKCKKMTDPPEPSAHEVAEHNLTHLPFRNWCRFGCGSRGVEMPHKKTDGDRALPELHFDVCFLGDESKRARWGKHCQC
jgi:hypothetical protein